MREPVERGSGSVTALAALGSVAALGFGVVAGIAILVHTTEALRLAEREAVVVATSLAEGVQDPCSRITPPVVTCTTQGGSATVTVELRGVRAGATAGPKR